MKKTTSCLTVLVLLVLCVCMIFFRLQENKDDSGSNFSPEPVLSTPELLPDILPSPSQLPEPAAEPFVSMLPAEPSPVQIQEKALPEARLYSFGVEAGKVRYVSQLNNVEGNGWGKYAWKAGMECTTACISMALSFLGIDASPEKLLDFSSKTYLYSCWGMEEEISISPFSAPSYTAEDVYPAFENMMDLYLNCADGSVSPVLVYLSGCGNNHAILIIGKEGDHYLAVDPTPIGIFRIFLSPNGEITTDEDNYLSRYTDGGSMSAKLISLGQWVKNEPG